MKEVKGGGPPSSFNAKEVGGGGGTAAVSGEIDEWSGQREALGSESAGEQEPRLEGSDGGRTVYIPVSAEEPVRVRVAERR